MRRLEWTGFYQIKALYLFVGESYEKDLWCYCQRFSNYCNLSFSNEEVITIYMLGTMQGLTDKKKIYEHAKNYWHELFPRLPSYVAFIQRINRLGDALIALACDLQEALPQDLFTIYHKSLIDSMPIIMARGNRRFKARVAPEIANKNGYCTAKKLYYYGIKLHMVGSAQHGILPVPEKIGIISAGTHGIKAYEFILPDILEYEKFADKAYGESLVVNTTTYTPIKKQKNQKFLDAADQLYSTAIARIRQPIESLFNWIEEKAKIQIASKVRSYNGLITHVLGKLSVALKLLIVRFSS